MVRTVIALDVSGDALRLKVLVEACLTGLPNPSRLVVPDLMVPDVLQDIQDQFILGSRDDPVDDFWREFLYVTR